MQGKRSMHCPRSPAYPACEARRRGKLGSAQCVGALSGTMAVASVTSPRSDRPTRGCSPRESGELVEEEQREAPHQESAALTHSPSIVLHVFGIGENIRWHIVATSKVMRDSVAEGLACVALCDRFQRFAHQRRSRDVSFLRRSSYPSTELARHLDREAVHLLLLCQHGMTRLFRIQDGNRAFHSNRPNKSSRVKAPEADASPRAASKSARFLSCSLRIFSSTVPWATSR